MEIAGRRKVKGTQLVKWIKHNSRNKTTNYILKQ